MASPKNLFGRSLSTEVCDKDVVYCGLLESISDEPKNIADDQNVVLSLNMDLEMLYLFSFKSSEGLFERFEKMITFLLMMKQHCFVYPISLFSNLLKIVELGRFVEQTLLYKVWYWTNLQLLPNCSHNHFVKISFPCETVMVKKSLF